MRTLCLLLLGAALTLLAQGCSGRRPSFPPDPWLTRKVGSRDPFAYKPLPGASICHIDPKAYPLAEQWLASQPIREISPAELRRLCPASPARFGDQRRLFVVRAVSVADPGSECMPTTDGRTLWVTCGMLTRHDITRLRHTPLVVALDAPPEHVIVSYSTAE